jgi:hypothetical protein
MVNKYKKSRLLFSLMLITLVTIIVLVSIWGVALAKKTGTTSPSLKNASRSGTSGTPGSQLTIVAHSPTAPTPTSAASPTTSTASTAAPSSGSFTTLAPGSPLPSDGTCDASVKRSSWEPRPENATANNTNLYAQGYRLTASYLSSYGYQPRVTGNFVGTTDEIIQWGACKWGIDVNIVRAQAQQESDWRQGALGDCQGGSAQTNGCQSVGLLQVKDADSPPTHPGTYPYARESTAFNVDYTLAVERACFEGKEVWLGNGYHAGDIWGCVGRWYSGDWYGDSPGYIASVKGHMASEDWLRPDF